jgi:demethylmenaquinone methyltransferase / 2-methoxy-6-polyprenyl-1,4-benzoquinol methylase
MSETLPVPTRNGSGAMFDGIARRYDLVNRIMSFGLDRRWRKQTVDALELGGGEACRVLDLATGTGDLALDIARRLPASQIVGLDPSVNMLEVGRRKVADRGLAGRIELVEGDAQALPWGDSSFDGVTIAFGIRNVPDRGRALAEMARVTRPGGRVAILELSEPRRGIMAPLARFHIRTLVPRIGALLSGAKEYRYLQQSIAAFPPAAEFATLMEASGLEMVAVKPFTFGVVHLYVGTPAKASGGASGRAGGRR